MIGVLRGLKQSELFGVVMKKMTLNMELSKKELEFSLSVAVVFLKEYNRNKSKGYLFELSYYIALKAAFNNSVIDPLLDISSNYGFYPVSKYILDRYGFESISYISLDYQLDKYSRKGIVETYEQRTYRSDLIESDSKDNSYVAPTSFGKSSLVIDIISSASECKVAIIVPTKSLLVQTVRLVKSNFPKRTVIFHDEMYSGESSFISVLTQERALRLLKSGNVSFDLMIVDEAHKIFEMDGRSILLTRLIRRNRKRNPKSINYYLSPLISDSGNLKVDGEQEFFERKILNNIKVPDVYEFHLDSKCFKYNKFLDEFYFKCESEGFIDYILDNSKNKNFLYLRSPYKVEMLCNELNDALEEIDSKELKELSKVVSDNVHEEFYCVDYLKKGLVYLHGKLPDLIKEYLEYKFSLVKDVKFVVANSVILEGVNLPIDNMFIMNTHALDDKGLMNLIGRVNRLNEVFDGEGDSIEKLMPSIHFVNTEKYNRKSSKMSGKISLLKIKKHSDSIKNPLLHNYNIDKLGREVEKAESGTDLDRLKEAEYRFKQTQDLIDRERFLIEREGDEESLTTRLLMEAGLESIYFDSDDVYPILEKRISKIKEADGWGEASVVDKVYLLFIQKLENRIKDRVFLRLKNNSARRYYMMFAEKLHRLNLKQHISDTVAYFSSIKDTESGREFYIGSSYGEFSKMNDGVYSRKSYIDLSAKTEKELVNLALIKIKIESDYVAYTINNYVSLLLDLGLITDKEHDLYVYGTETKINSNFVRLGMSGALINKLKSDGQLSNLLIDQYGTLNSNNEFRTYIKLQDDLIQFEVSKFLDLE